MCVLQGHLFTFQYVFVLLVAYFATTGGGVRELTNALPESIYTSSLSKGGFKLPPLLNVLATAHLDAPPYKYKSVLLLTP